jgi:small-conductance mechanosensitive channel
MTWQVFQEAITTSWEDVITRVINFIPELVGAVVILVIGWIVAVLLDRLFDRILRSIGLQDLFEKIKAEELVKRTGIELDATALLGRLVKWIILLIAFLAAADILGLARVAEFFGDILAYIPNVIVAVAILVVASVLATFLAEVVKASLRAGRLAYSSFLGELVRWAIWIFAILVALYQLGVATGMIATLFTGLVAMLAIAGGLAFGLGGQDQARELLEKVREGVRSKEPTEEEEQELEGIEQDEIEL